MGALAPPSPPWTLEDDILLKNSVEAGASLEALAKGAVSFSRRYTLQEVQDRWYSLLYDPIVSEQASAQMILKLNNPETSKDIQCSKRKRTAESIRKSYYAMRKRICNEPLDVMGPNLFPWTLNESLPADYMSNNPSSDNLLIQGSKYDTRHPFPEMLTYAQEFATDDVTPFPTAGQQHCSYEANSSLTGDHIDVLGYGNFLGPESELNACSNLGSDQFHSFGIPPSLPHIPTWATSGDSSASALPFDTVDSFLLPEAGNGNTSNSSMEPVMLCDSLGQLSPDTVEYIAEINNSLFELVNEDEQHIMGTEGENELLFLNSKGENELLVMDTEVDDDLDQAYIDGLTSLLMDDSDQVEVPNANICEAEIAIGGSSVGAVGQHLNEGLYYNSDIVLDPQVQSDIRNRTGPEYRNGVICCTLNTEHPDIPSNDDVFLPFRFPSPTFNSGAQWKRDTSKVGASVKDSSSTRKPDGMKKMNQKVTVPASHSVGSSKLPTTGLQQKVKVEPVEPKKAIDSELAARISSANATANKFVAKVIKNAPTETIRGNGAIIPQTSRGKSEVEVLNKALKIEELRQTPIIPQPVGDTLLPDEKEPLCEDEYDVPHFSDVESMILDEDLSPDDYDIFANSHVKQYQNESSKRNIVRLEQFNKASIHREMSVKGAFAVLYGRNRNTKHFIKKSEVLLGRSTEDVKVDIDMGRENNGSKISRRQAMIKIDTCGVFHLKNLGKCSIFVNEKEVLTNHTTCLDPGCLIQIRKQAFLFETNPSLLKQQL